MNNIEKSMTNILVAKSKYLKEKGIDPLVFSQLDKDKSVLEQQLSSLKEQSDQLKKEAQTQVGEMLRMTTELTQWKTNYTNLDEKLAVQKKEIPLFIIISSKKTVTRDGAIKTSIFLSPFISSKYKTQMANHNPAFLQRDQAVSYVHDGKQTEWPRVSANPPLVLRHTHLIFYQ